MQLDGALVPIIDHDKKFFSSYFFHEIDLLLDQLKPQAFTAMFRDNIGIIDIDRIWRNLNRIAIALLQIDRSVREPSIPGNLLFHKNHKALLPFFKTTAKDLRFIFTAKQLLHLTGTAAANFTQPPIRVERKRWNFI